VVPLKYWQCTCSCGPEAAQGASSEHSWPPHTVSAYGVQGVVVSMPRDSQLALQFRHTPSCPLVQLDRYFPALHAVYAWQV
jgi:hypothetical protein